MGNGKEIAGESWDVEGDIETVQRKWAEFTMTLRFAPGPWKDRFSWVRPETDGEAERIVFREIDPAVTRVTVAVRYDDDDLLQEGETFADVAHRVDRDMAFFKDYVEERLPKEWPVSNAS